MYMPHKKISHSSHTRILALDLHPRRFGYAVVEKPGKLLDWGVRRSDTKTENNPEALVARRLRQLLAMWLPDVVVTRVGMLRGARVHALFKHIRREVGPRLFLPVRSSRADSIGRSKYERAAEMAARFPEIAWKLPARRKFFESEHYSMSIFAALEIAVAYLSKLS